MVKSNQLGLIVVFLVTAVLAYRIIDIFIKLPSPIFYYDQWGDFFLWKDQFKPLALFLHNSGVHYKGPVLWISWLVVRAANFSAMSESWHVLFWFILAASLALFLKYRLFKRMSVFDAIIPFLFLSVRYHGNLLQLPLPSIYIAPIAMLLLLGILTTYKTNRLRVLIEFFLIGVLTFSGYGYWVLPGYLLLNLAGFIRGKQRLTVLISKLAVVSMVIILFLSLRGKTFATGADCFQFPHPEPAEYLPYALVIYGSYFLPATMGGLVLAIGFLLIVLILVESVKQLITDSAISKPSFLFLSYGLLYSLGATIGRVCLGIETAAESRYAIFVSLALLGIYFSFNQIRNRFYRNLLLSGLLLGLALSEVFSFPYYLKDIQGYINERRVIVQCLLKGENIVECSQLTQADIYPRPEEINQHVEWLRATKKGLFTAAPDNP